MISRATRQTLLPSVFDFAYPLPQNRPTRVAYRVGYLVQIYGRGYEIGPARLSVIKNRAVENGRGKKILNKKRNGFRKSVGTSVFSFFVFIFYGFPYP